MWKLKTLIEHCNDKCQLPNGKWVPSKPLNSCKEYQSFFQRLKNAWNVFQCKYNTFIWPEDE